MRKEFIPAFIMLNFSSNKTINTLFTSQPVYGLSSTFFFVFFEAVICFLADHFLVFRNFTVPPLVEVELVALATSSITSGNLVGVGL
jgi:hypothetical protein